MHCVTPVHYKKEINADTKVHLAQAQALIYKAESSAALNIFLLYLFGEKKLNNFQVSQRFQGPIVSYFSAALSCEQWPFFLVTRLFLETLLSIAKSDRLNKSKVESCKPAKTRASQKTNPTGKGEKDNIKSRPF